MTEKLAEQIRQLAERHNDLLVAQAFVDRLETGEGLTRDENPYTHYCVYFAAYDPAAGQIFIGHHKKSDLWLFNGGHIDGYLLGQPPDRSVSARRVGRSAKPAAGLPTAALIRGRI